MTLELNPTPASVLIEGASGCGKTAALVERAAALLDTGTAPGDVLVLAATPDAARALAKRLAERTPAGAEVRATCVRDVALELLATDAGRAFSGRAGRLVTPVEMGFVMEDMKTSGLKSRRLREMLKFFYRSWTELVEGADGTDDWLIPGEEADVHALLKEVLAFTGGILEPEAAAMALRFLLSDEAALAAARRPHVLVDDYQMHSRASQHLANLLAGTSIAVAADPAAVTEVFDSYPYGAGVDEFAQANEACERIVLDTCHSCAASTQAASRLRASLSCGAGSDEIGTKTSADAPEAAAASFTALEAADPAAEMDAVADAVQAALEAGADPSSVYVLAFHPAWERRIAGALEARGIAVATPVRGRAAAGDYRELDRCAAARLLVALALIADPADALAWRAWCGFGDYLANSAAFADMRAEGEARGEGLVAMLDEAAAASDEGFPATGIGRVLDAYRAGRVLIQHAQGLEGDELLSTLVSLLNVPEEEGERALHLVRTLVAPEPEPTAPSASEAPAAPASDAAALIGRARHRMDAPVFENAEGCILVGDSAHLAGLTPATLVLCGFVNGFFPSRDYFDATVMPPDRQKLVRDADTRRLYAAVGKARKRLVASWFTATNLVEAETLKMEIGRVRLRRGERIATTSPSIYLKEISPNTAPSV